MLIVIAAVSCDIQGEPKKSYNTKITISQKCVNIFIQNFAHLFTKQLCKSVLLCAVFTWHTPNWRKRKLQERILQLNRRLTL